MQIKRFFINWLIILLTIFIVNACKKDEIETIPIEVSAGWFPEKPVNITGLNTIYDDYNTNLEGQGKRVDLFYSTNAPKKGIDYDITGVSIDIVVDKDMNSLGFSIANDQPDYSFELFPLINTSANEYGPYSFYSDDDYDANTKWFFFYANDEKGQFDIKFTYTFLRNWGSNGANREIYGPFDATVLNSNVCDFYPTISKDYSQILFSSYRKGKYDLYEIETDTVDLVNWLMSGTNSANLNQTLSSAGNDKCPYIKGNLMVFASDNPEGFGGYDLWYSVFENETWSKPKNFGPEINSPYDEFRPAIEHFPQSNNDLMIFSSNRPTGVGGYDLHYVGIPKMIN